MADSVITQYETMIWGTEKQEQKIGTQKKDHDWMDITSSCSSIMMNIA